MRFGRAHRSTSGAVTVAVLLCMLASCSPSSTPSTTSPPETTAAPATSAQTTPRPQRLARMSQHSSPHSRPSPKVRPCRTVSERSPPRSTTSRPT